MSDLQIKITDDGVLIPREYLKQSREFELEVQNGDVLIRPKPGHTSELLPSESSRFSFVGIGKSSNPNASAEVEEILQQELGRTEKIE